jgi:hypothetical protein
MAQQRITERKFPPAEAEGQSQRVFEGRRSLTLGEGDSPWVHVCNAACAGLAMAWARHSRQLISRAEEHKGSGDQEEGDGHLRSRLVVGLLAVHAIGLGFELSSGEVLDLHLPAARREIAPLRNGPDGGPDRVGKRSSTPEVIYCVLSLHMVPDLSRLKP